MPVGWRVPLPGDETERYLFSVALLSDAICQSFYQNRYICQLLLHLLVINQHISLGRTVNSVVFERIHVTFFGNNYVVILGC